MFLSVEQSPCASQGPLIGAIVGVLLVGQAQCRRATIWGPWPGTNGVATMNRHAAFSCLVRMSEIHMASASISISITEGAGKRGLISPGWL